MRTAAVALLVGLVSSPAFASPARVEALSGNRAFTDDTDVFRYPSVIAETGDAVQLNYGAATGVDGGVTWDGKHSLW